MTGFPIDHVQKECLMHIKMHKMIGQVLYEPGSYYRTFRARAFGSSISHMCMGAVVSSRREYGYRYPDAQDALEAAIRADIPLQYANGVRDRSEVTHSAHPIARVCPRT